MRYASDWQHPPIDLVDGITCGRFDFKVVIKYGQSRGVGDGGCAGDPQEDQDLDCLFDAPKDCLNVLARSRIQMLR